MPELAKVTEKYFPISHKDINLVVVAKSTYIVFDSRVELSSEGQ